ncbi:hypothetical protein LTS14_001024 [Recurvomyces mirabilis]|uniref:uncharacterized protein n=1 Tax=Recurvomyces mirabilis TaxID=574656 RepID=UPI002DDF902D|nr:hypothetical protein LTS14_001024 [Recurvomyces mirabilis]
MSQEDAVQDQVTLYESSTQLATLTTLPRTDSRGGQEVTSTYIDEIVPILNLSDCEEEHLTNLFYSNFHPAHPILVPRTFYRKEAVPRYLRLVICFVGSHYATGRHSRDSLAPVVAQAMTSTIDCTASRVQALVLYTIVLHASHQAREASSCISEAAKLAIDIGLDRPSFATDMAPHDLRQQESLRRIWYELYIVDGYMAALSRQPSFRSNSVGTHPYLPCEDSLYARGVCDLHPRSLAQFDDRVFATAPCTFSSYCYRIDAIRIIARVLAVAGANDACPDEVQAVDNAIASWKYHLPSNKADVIDQYGNVDHMLFQANVFIQWATILLHFPRSDLPMTVPTDENLACAKDLPRISATSAQHTVKAVAASKELSNLAALPWCVTLSACSSHARTCLQQHRDRVTLMIGALKTLGKTWAVARNALQHLMKVAHNIFCTQSAGSSPVVCSSVHDSGIGLDSIPGDMSWFDLFSLDELSGGVPMGFGLGSGPLESAAA